jgi:hypothetical protein
MSGQGTPAQFAAFLMALKMRGENVDEITAAASVIRGKVIPVQAPDGAMDVVGTGGDGAHTLNISTATAIVAAEPSPSRELVPLAAVASPDPAYVPPPFSRRPLTRPSRRPSLALPPPPPSLPSTTPQSLEERLLADAHRQLERTVV